MNHLIRSVSTTLLAILLNHPTLLLSQPLKDPVPGNPVITVRDWTYVTPHLPLDLKWRRHLESNLRWMIARARTRPAEHQPRIVVYADAGTNYQLNGNIVTALESAGIPCQVLDRSRIATAQLEGIEAYIMPGGYSTFQRHALGNRGITSLQQFVQGGGRFLGICAGGYLASKDVHWEQKHYPYPLELFDGTAEGALDSIAAWPRDASVSLTLTEAGKRRGLTAEAEGVFYYKGGPHFHGGSQSTVLATYPDGKAAIICRPYGDGEVVLNGIHYERPSPRPGETDQVPPAPRSTSNVLLGLLDITPRKPSRIHPHIDSAIKRWIDVTDLAKEDRINLEQNLRWILARAVAPARTRKRPRVGLFADAGVAHQSLTGMAALLEAQHVSIEPLLHTDICDQQLESLDVLIIPAGNHRILRDTLGDSGQQAIRQFIESGKQLVSISTGAYLPAKTIRWQQRTWEYPLKYFPGMAEGPLPTLATWPATAQVPLKPTANGIARGLTEPLLKHCLYHGGPRFVDGHGHQVLAHYPDQSAAIVSTPVGRGEVLLIGVGVSLPAASTRTASFLPKLLKIR